MTHLLSGLIDLHHHAIPAWYRETLLQNAPRGEAFMPLWSVEEDLALMKRQGIATAILSMTFAPAGAAARRLNEDLAALIQQYPRQYGALGILPLPDIQAATREAVYALDTLQMDGTLLSNYQGFYLSDDGSDELLSELNQRNAVVFLHPTDPPGGSHSTVSALYEFPLETTRAIALLLERGKLKQYPQIRWILAHAGGTLPYLAYRLSAMLPTIHGAHFGASVWV